MKTATDLLAATAAALLCWLALQAAPVPPAKPLVAPPSLAGAWVAYWHTCPWQTVLLEGGDYAAERTGADGVPTRFVGTWRMDGPVIEIREGLVTEHGVGTMATYRFALKRGTTESACGGLRLVRSR